MDSKVRGRRQPVTAHKMSKEMFNRYQTAPSTIPKEKAPPATVSDLVPDSIKSVEMHIDKGGIVQHLQGKG